MWAACGPIIPQSDVRHTRAEENRCPLPRSREYGGGHSASARTPAASDRQQMLCHREYRPEANRMDEMPRPPRLQLLDAWAPGIEWLEAAEDGRCAIAGVMWGDSSIMVPQRTDWDARGEACRWDG